ncbi:two-component regulator propeller domain-containing protein [Acidicapsa dinghuensis]|uniref:Two-component regulator propeller domain-containing protein n=1 Tax=Acidicapsa dinghuensis TaxID=2218256 RepID=A0ABW1EIK1_9BACT|nr:sensor histidine kinase [Acidicapsa dinghuensis]
MRSGCRRNTEQRTKRRWAQPGVWLVIACMNVTVVCGVARQAWGIPRANLSLSEYQKQEWQVEDGLPANNVRAIAQRADGSLVIATSAGISSFDGIHFRAEPIDGAAAGDPDRDNEAVNAVLPVGADEMWIGTDGRGVLHQTASGTVNVSEAAGRYHERIRNLYRDTHGVVWIATQNGVERFANGKLEAVNAGGMIIGSIVAPFAEGSDGGMFFVTSSGLYRWKHGEVAPYLLHEIQNEPAIALYRDVQGNVWVGTSHHVVELTLKKALQESRGGREYDEAVKASVPDSVSVMIGDAMGNLWIGTRRAGLWRLSKEGLQGWSTHDGLADDAIRSLFLDDEQNLWVGMLSGGLSRWRKGALAPYGDPEGMHATYTANVLADSHGDLWLGTWDKGLFRRHDGRLIPTSPPGMPISTPIRALAEDRKHQVWVGTWYDGIYRYDGSTFHHYHLSNESPGNAVSAILTAKDGGLWIGTYTGLLYFAKGEPSRYGGVLFLDSQLVTCLLEDRDGSVLVGTNAGLYRVRNGKTQTIDGLDHAYILSLTIDSGGYVWVGTKRGGLMAMVGDHVTAVPAGAGFPEFQVNTAIEDKDAHLWFGTSRGIVRVAAADLHAVMEGRRNTLSAVILDKADGMRSSECSGPSLPLAARMPDDTLWFATTKGFVHTTDAAEMLGGSQPAARIMGWTPMIDPNSAELVPTTSKKLVDLEAGHSDLLLFFHAKLLSNPSHLEFRYRLTGYDSSWTTTRAHVARYRHLPPGNYTFEVQARRSGEDWSTPVATIAVKQSPFIYQTWYFYALLFLIAVAVVIQIFRRRLQLMKGRMGIVLEERSRIARECHDTLMAGFAAVSWQLEATAKLFRDSKSESTPAAQSCALARSMVSHCQAEARRIIWDLRDTDEVTNVLSHALARTLSANVAPETIETTFEVDGDELPLAPGCVHHLVCIGQEAVSNAIKHAEARHIAIQLRYDDDALALSIRDDGRGFQRGDAKEGNSKHFGISVMEERARKVGGMLRLQTMPGVGTEVTVDVPFNPLLQPLRRDQEHHVIRWIGI